MFFDYCILLGRTSSEFWESRPAQVIYCIEKYEEIINRKMSENAPATSTQIISMRDIAGWGDRA